MIRFKKIMVVMLAVVFAISLCACGEKGSKVKDYAGYYIYEDPNSSNVKFTYEAMNINKDGDVILRVRMYDMNYWNFPRTGVTKGTLNIEENRGIFYNTSFEGTDEKINLSAYFPLILTMLNDDELYVDSEATGWEADAYKKVDKKEFDSFCTEHELYLKTEVAE